MKQPHVDDQVVPYPKIKRFLAAAYRSVQHKPMIHGLLEVDVTRARAHLREHQAKTGKSLSFTAFLIACLAKAVDEHKAVQAIRFGSKRLILFEEVDVLTDIERDVAGQKFVVPHIVRAANRKTVRELHDEIRAAQGADVKNVLKRFPFLFLPTMLYRPFLWAFALLGRGRPLLWKTIVNGHTAVREYLSLTISVDHEIVDGAPAARFTGRLKELIESGYGLDDYIVAPEQAAASAAAQKR